MPRKHTLFSTLLACTQLWACSSDGPGVLQNPNAAGAPAPAAGGSGTSAAASGTGSAGMSIGTAGSVAVTAGTGTAAASGAAGKAGAAAGGTGGSGGTAATAGTTAGGAGAMAAAGGGATAGTGETGGGAFEMCVAALKPKCGYSDKETACSSFMTPVIPLTAGGNWGDNEIKAGPYGGYVEWNEGMAFANPVSASEDSCPLVAGSFGEPASTTADVLDLRGGDLSLYTVFRPACMKDGEKYPVITWGNGTCGQSGAYASLLASVASYGFVVFAANSRFTDAGNNEMLKALDFAKAANEDSKSIFYQKLDLDKIGAMGHSQGSSATANAAKDPRIKAVILWNGGSSASKPFLAVSGERDITGYSAASMASAVMNASQPGGWLFYHKILETGGSVTGHLTLMEQPERTVEPAVAWWKYMLLGDQEARKMFVGADCGLCNHKDDYEFGGHNLP
jgi:hypothetical protein